MTPKQRQRLDTIQRTARSLAYDRDVYAEPPSISDVARQVEELCDLLAELYVAETSETYRRGWLDARDRILAMLEGPPQLENIRRGIAKLRPPKRSP